MSKIIVIDNKTRINVISSNYALQYKIKNEKGEMIWVTDGYFANIGQCAVEALNNSPREDGKAMSDLRDVIEVLKASEKKLIKTLK